MPGRDLVAIDVALLLPDWVNQRARAVNAALLAQRPDGFRFDETHLPHITLAQLFVRRGNLPTLIERLDPVLGSAAPLKLRVTGVGSSGTTAHFAVEPTPDLRKLHETVMDSVQSLEETGGGAEAFYSEGEPARENDIAWVSQFRSHSRYARFSPHVTLGAGPPPVGMLPSALADMGSGPQGGPLPEFRDPFEFTARRTALCHLGRFCTCRIVLREWWLGAGKT